MKTVTIIINSAQSLKGCSDVIELDILAVKGSARGLDMVFKFLGFFISPVFIFHGHGPDPPCHSSDHCIFRVHPIGKEKGKGGSKGIDIHAPGKIILHIGKPVCQG